MPSANRTQEMLRQLVSARNDRTPQVRVGALVLRRYRGIVSVSTVSADAPAGWATVPWRNAGSVRLPDGGRVLAQEVVGDGVSCARLGAAFAELRRRAGGERMRLHDGGPTRTLTNLMQERAIPPWTRDSLPLLYCDGQLVWIPMVGVASEFRARAGEAGLELRWEPPRVSPSD